MHYIKVNDNNELQLNLRGDVIYAENEDDDDRVEFTLRLLDVEHLFVCPLPFEGDRSVQVSVYSPQDAEEPAFTVKALVKEKNKRQSLTFLINILFWQIVMIVPVPDEPTETDDGKTEQQTVPVYCKPSTLKRHDRGDRGAERVVESQTTSE